MHKIEEFESILEQHRLWLASDKQQGSRADFSGSNLSGMDFSAADLRAAIFQNASLAKANLQQVNLIHADFADANLRGANISGAQLSLTNFTAADLRDADLSDTKPNVDAEHHSLHRGPSFTDADLRGANLDDSYCESSDFSGSNMQGASLSRAQLNKAKLSNLNLSSISMAGADLHSATILGSNLDNVNLRGANLRNANLSGAVLTDADLSDACLMAANLAECKVDGIQYDRSTKFRGVRVDSCFGSSRFKRFAMDQDFIEEFQEDHPYAFYLWFALTDCGRSLTRVGCWVVGLIVLFALLFYLQGASALAINVESGLSWNFATTLYYSTVTFTTLGFGDITPRTPMAALLVTIEVGVGYLMLGILISILASKVARRS